MVPVSVPVKVEPPLVRPSSVGAESDDAGARQAADRFEAASRTVPPFTATEAVSAIALPPASTSVPSVIVQAPMPVGVAIVQVPVPDLVALSMLRTVPSVAEPLPTSASVSLPAPPSSAAGQRRAGVQRDQVGAVAPFVIAVQLAEDVDRARAVAGRGDQSGGGRACIQVDRDRVAAGQQHRQVAARDRAASTGWSVAAPPA